MQRLDGASRNLEMQPQGPVQVRELALLASLGKYCYGMFCKERTCVEGSASRLNSPGRPILFCEKKNLYEIIANFSN